MPNAIIPLVSSFGTESLDFMVKMVYVYYNLNSDYINL